MGWGWGGVVCGWRGAGERRVFWFESEPFFALHVFLSKVDGSPCPRPPPQHRLPSLPALPCSPHTSLQTPKLSPGSRHHCARRLRPRRASKCRAGCMHARRRRARGRSRLTAGLQDAGQAS